MNKGGIGCVVVFVLLLTLGITLYTTCPTKADHRNALNEAVTAVINERLGEQRYDIMGKIANVLGKKMLNETSEVAINQMLHVDDYVFISVGRIHFKGRDHIVSVGVLGHVFAPDKDDLQALLSEHGI